MTAAPLEPVRETLHELFDRANARSDPGFDPTASPLHGRAIFVVGAPRSGTTWLHQLLAVHPDIATGGEAHVVCEGVAALFENHDHSDQYMYLSTWVRRGELLTLTRQLIDGIFTTLRDAQRPNATHVLDKTPDHKPHARLLAELYPDATFIHIIRDGRDVAASAHDLWADFGGAYSNIGAAAAIWRDAVRDVRAHLSPLRYHEVRYEELVADPVGGLAAILDVAGLRHDPPFLEEVIAFGRAPINVRPSDGRLGARKWSDAGLEHEQAVFTAAGDLLVDLGYVTASEVTETLRRRTWASTKADIVTTGRRLGGGARRRVQAAMTERRRKARVGAVDDVRRPGRALAEHLVAGTDPGALLAAGVAAELPGATHRGRDDVVRALAGVAGSRIAAVTADATAVAVQLVDGAGHRHLHRYFVEGGTVVRIVVQE